MMLRMCCPSCGKTLGFGKKLAGRTVSCPNCNSPVELPAAGVAQASQVPARYERKSKLDSLPEVPAIPAIPPPLESSNSSTFPTTTPDVSDTAATTPTKREKAKKSLDYRIAIGVFGLVGVLILIFVLALVIGSRLGDQTDTTIAKESMEGDSNVRESVETNPGSALLRSLNRNRSQRTNSELMDLPALIKRVEQAVVRIDTDNGVGTGFLVENASTVVTNFHVIHSSQKATAVFKDGKKVPVMGALAVIPECDLAALLIPDQKAAPLRLAAAAPEKGERVVAFGMPEGLSFSASEGIVSATRTGRELGDSFRTSLEINVIEMIGLKPESRWVQTSAPISHGNSGGPLVNMHGEVVGVNTMMHAAGQNLNFAVSAEEVKCLLELAKRPMIPLSILSKPESTPRPNLLISQEEALKGLRGVELICGDVSREAKIWGMGQEEIRNLVTRRLRSAGIKVADSDDSKGPIGLLHVKVNVLASESAIMPILVFVVECELSRFVALNPYAKDRVDLALAVVWQARASYGFAGRQVFREGIRDSLNKVTDQFIDAFCAVNN